MKDELELIRHNKDAEWKRHQKRKYARRLERKSNITFFITMGITAFVLIVRLFILDLNIVHGSSMYPTLKDKDLLLVEKYDITNINRYDIITIDTLDSNHEKVRIIKRVYGLPGETIEIHRDGSVYINGVRLPDEYQILHTVDIAMRQGNEEHVLNEVVYKEVLGSGQYYVLGDNRDASQDSRYYGPFDRDSIRGVVVCRIKPFTSIHDTEVINTKKG